MPAESADMCTTSAALPMELRASLDVLFELLAGERGVIRTTTIGDPSLIAALGNYGAIQSDRDHSTFLAIAANEISLVIERDQPGRVTVLGSGGLQRIIRPLRRGTALIPRVPENAWWERRGYQLVRPIKVQGVGSLFWSGCDRLLRRFDRPHLADRCRIAMLRTLVAARWRFVPATLHIRDYRRVA